LLAHGRWFSQGTPASSTTKTGRHDKVTLADFGESVYVFDFIAPKTLHYLAFKSFDFMLT
jgi:hypothetical protein